MQEGTGINRINTGLNTFIRLSNSLLYFKEALNDMIFATLDDVWRKSIKQKIHL